MIRLMMEVMQCLGVADEDDGWRHGVVWLDGETGMVWSELS